MSDELKAAVERLRRGRTGEDARAIYPDIPARDRSIAMATDNALVVSAYLAEHKPDDAEPIDAGWLRRVGAIQDDHPIKFTFSREHAMPIGLWSVDDGWKAMLIHSEHAASCIVRGLKTRYDVRNLAAALQITLND